MSVLDWVLVVVWLGLALGGFWKGAVRLIFGGGGLIAGLWLAMVAGDDARVFVESLIGVPWLAAVIAYVALVLLCVGLALLAGWGIEHTLQTLHLGWLNRLFGAFLAAAVAALLLGLLVIVAIQFSPDLARLCHESVVAQYLLWVSETLLGAVEYVDI